VGTLLVKSGRGERGTAAAAAEVVMERQANGTVPSIKCSNMESESH